jgi:hypothetical protein
MIQSDKKNFGNNGMKGFPIYSIRKVQSMYRNITIIITQNIVNVNTLTKINK